MSYSIFVVFNNDGERDDMLAFLESQFKPLSELVPPAFAGILESDSHLPHHDLGYLGDFTGPLLGYDYGGGTMDLERDYRFALCVWMAIHAGKQLNNQPTVIYDGESEMTICVAGRDNCPCTSDIHTDADGFKTLSTLSLMEHTLDSIVAVDLSDENPMLDNNQPFVRHLKETNQNVRDEIKRLTRMWLTQKQKKPEMEC